jgi:hypothetical protein
MACGQPFFYELLARAMDRRQSHAQKLHDPLVVPARPRFALIHSQQNHGPLPGILGHPPLRHEIIQLLAFVHRQPHNKLGILAHLRSPGICWSSTKSELSKMLAPVKLERARH